MMYLLYGTDADEKQKAYKELLESLSPSNEACLRRQALFFVSDVDFEPDKLEDHIGGAGLFSDRNVIVLEHVLENEEARDFILSKLKELKGSPNIFIFLEREVPKKVLDKIKKTAEKTLEFKEPDIPMHKKFDVFLLTNALAERNKKKVWTVYHKALSKGALPEELVGILFWQIKTLLLVKEGNTSGLHPFVVKKSKAFSANWGLDELRQLSSRFVALHHESRRTGRELGLELEKFLLSI